jgi:signal transduction histidine kinase/ActR/RegA family two-component response regulator
MLKEFIERGKCGPFEKDYVRADGVRVPVMVYAAEVVPGDRENGMAFIVDLTHLKEAEAALKRSQEELKSLNESLERRVQERTEEARRSAEQLRALALDLTETESRERKRLATLLHDHFQQLISAAKLKVGLVRGRLDDPQRAQSLEQAEGLLEEAISASRSLATELSPPVLHDAGLRAGLEWLVRRMQRDHHLEVNLKVDPECEPDNEQMRVILFECVRELLFNIVKHAETKRASLEMTSCSGDLLQVVVEDDGKGFNVAELMTQSRANGSFGLLNIRERLGLLGGSIQVQSRPGEGTRVVVTVPASLRPQSAPRDDGPFALPAPKPPEHPVPTVRVLVADDHRLFREGLITLISQELFVNVVGQAADGAEALDLARQLKPDIMIVDVSMPKLNGIQVTSAVKRELPGTRIIGLSMHEREDMARAMRDAGAFAYCTKSGPIESLLSTLRSAATPEVP